VVSPALHARRPGRKHHRPQDGRRLGRLKERDCDRRFHLLRSLGPALRPAPARCLGQRRPRVLGGLGGDPRLGQVERRGPSRDRRGRLFLLRRLTRLGRVPGVARRPRMPAPRTSGSCRCCTDRSRRPGARDVAAHNWIDSIRAPPSTRLSPRSSGRLRPSPSTFGPTHGCSFGPRSGRPTPATAPTCSEART